MIEESSTLPTPRDARLAALVADLARIADGLAKVSQHLSLELQGRTGSSDIDLALLAKPEPVMDETMTHLTTPPISELKLVFTPAEVARALAIHPRTLSRMRAAGQGPSPIKIRGSVRYKAADVERWLEGKRSA